MLQVNVGSHTDLRVSTSELRFEVIDRTNPPEIPVDYSAAARTRQDGEVVLTVESLGVRTSENVPAPGLVVAYGGVGLKEGTLAVAGPRVVGTWTGSGVRPGRVIFSLLGATKPGVYLLSLKFNLSAP